MHSSNCMRYLYSYMPKLQTPQVECLVTQLHALTCTIINILPYIIVPL